MKALIAPGERRPRTPDRIALAIMSSVLVAASSTHVGTASAEDQCQEWDTAVTTTPAPPQSAATMRALILLMRTVPPAADVVVIGDSLAAAISAPLVQGLYPGQRIWNAGVGADRTQQVLWRLRMLRGKIHPRHVLVILGTNNLAGGDKPCAIVAGIASVVEFVNQIWESPRLTYLTIPPRLPASIEARRLETNKLAHELAGHGISIVDADDLKDCHECYLPDGIHLTTAGYKVIVEDIANQISGARKIGR